LIRNWIPPGFEATGFEGTGFGSEVGLVYAWPLMDSATFRSPAKINLHLRVAAPTADGFHPLRSWMVGVGLYDELTFRSVDAGVELTCSDPALPVDGTNLVHRAATALLRAAGSRRGVSIHLTKRIPAGAGLGGGSANAATTLVGVDRLLELNTPAKVLHELAATLGSDVPFFLGSPSAIATGRGESLTPCAPPARARTALLVFPPFGISTAAAYRALDARRPTAPEWLLDPFPADAWAALPARELLDVLVNDLEPPVFAIEPRLDALKRMIETRLGRAVRMSGSGSTLFSLFDAEDEARRAGQAVANGSVRVAVVGLGEARIEEI
jgi:4-diphosphocytidyl-2-C-methyl-D-erythritol kinase